MPIASAKCIRKRTASALLCLCALGTIALWVREPQLRQFAGKQPHVRVALESEVCTFVRAIRPAYPYSVIPGGAYSQHELRDSVSLDPVVASHYSGFNIGHAVLLRTTAPMLRYVSYRKGNRIAWTKKALHIPTGEFVLSDGVSVARARCGNRLSAKPIKAAFEDEPDLELSLPDIEAPRSKVALAPLPGFDVEPLTPFLFRSPLNPLSLLESDAGATKANAEALMPFNTMPPWFVPGIGAPGVAGSGREVAPIVSSIAISPSDKPTAQVAIPEPSTVREVTLSFGVALLLMLFRKRISRKGERSGC